MGISKGLLIQPYASVRFGDINLSAYPGASGELERIAQNVSLSFSKTEEAPSCEFEMAPTPDGFEIAAQIRNSPELLSQVVDVEMGYDHLPDFNLACKYLVSGLNWTTGLDPKLKFTLTSAVKSSWTDNKINVTMEEEMPLSEFPAFLQELAGPGAAQLKWKFTGQSEVDAADIMIKKNSMNQTPQQILNEVLKEHGMEMRPHDTALDGSVCIGYVAAKEGELEIDKPELDIPPTCCKRRVHILGPALMENASRKQQFTLGQTDVQGGSKNKATGATETENPEVTKKAPLASQAAAAGAVNPGAKTMGTSDEAQARSGTTKSAGDKKDARAALAGALATTLDATFPMLPQMVGMKPADIICIPSLKGDTLEDYEIQTVKYQFNSEGHVSMSVNATRPYLGDEHILDEGSVSEVLGVVSSLNTLDSWAQYYWRQGPTTAWPLSG